MKIRLDQYLCQNGYAQSRERAKALIMSGIVFVNEQKVDKAGELSLYTSDAADDLPCVDLGGRRIIKKKKKNKKKKKKQNSVYK